MSNHEELKSVLQQVDSRRRGFLSKILAGGAAAAALPAMSTIVLADEDGPGTGQRKGRRGKGAQGAKGKGGKGKGGQNGRRRDPATIAAQLIEEHDKDGDNALNAKELEAALKAMIAGRQRSGQRRPQGRNARGKGKGAQGAQGKGKGGRGKGKGNRGDNEAGLGGGVRPARPGKDG